MELLASCNLEQAKGFNGKLVIPNEDERHPDKVYLNIEYHPEDGSEEEFFKKVSDLNKSLVRCISFPSNEVSLKVPKEWEGRVFIYTDVDTLMDPNYVEIENAISLVHLDADFPSSKYKLNLKDLVKICENNSSVRFMGGNLLKVEGLRIGRFDEGKEKMSPVFKDIYDSFVEVSLNDLDGLKEIVSKTRKKAERSETSGTKKAKVRSPKSQKSSKSKRAEAAFKLFGGMEEDF